MQMQERIIISSVFKIKTELIMISLTVKELTLNPITFALPEHI